MYGYGDECPIGICSMHGGSSDDEDSDDEDRTTFMDVLETARNDFATGSETVEVFIDWVSDSWSDWTSGGGDPNGSNCDWCNRGQQ